MKKHISLIILFFSIVVTAQAQQPACEAVRTGKFKIGKGEPGTSYLIRRKDVQREIDKEKKVITEYTITWIDDCTYELKGMKVIKGKIDYKADPKWIVRVEILSITRTYYTARISSNFSDQVFEMDIEILK